MHFCPPRGDIVKILSGSLQPFVCGITTFVVRAVLQKRSGDHPKTTSPTSMARPATMAVRPKTNSKSQSTSVFLTSEGNVECLGRSMVRSGSCDTVQLSGDAIVGLDVVVDTRMGMTSIKAMSCTSDVDVDVIAIAGSSS